jgi:hypothetical protein
MWMPRGADGLIICETGFLILNYMLNEQPTNTKLLKIMTERFDKVDTRLDELEQNIQEDIHEVGKIVATKTDLEELEKTVKNLPNKAFLDERIGKLKDDVAKKRNAMKDAFFRIADIFIKGKYLEEVDRRDLKVVKEELEKALQRQVY